MTDPSLETGTAKAAVLFIVQHLERPTMMHVLKILYFAEQKKLVAHGTRIVEDTYYKMKDGPVLSKIYDAMKMARGDKKPVAEWKSFCHAVEFTDHIHLKAREFPDMDYLTKWDIDCLQQAIEENKKESAKKLSDKSHGYAWNSVPLNSRIRIQDIAKEGGASPQMLKYIQENEELYVLNCD